MARNAARLAMPTIWPLLPLEHLGEYGVDRVDDAEEVDLNHFFQLGDVQVVHHRDAADSGARDQDVDRPQPGRHGVDRRAHLVAAPDVGEPPRRSGPRPPPTPRSIGSIPDRPDRPVRARRLRGPTESTARGPMPPAAPVTSAVRSLKCMGSVPPVSRPAVAGSGVLLTPRPPRLYGRRPGTVTPHDRIHELLDTRPAAR